MTGPGSTTGESIEESMERIVHGIVWAVNERHLGSWSPTTGTFEPDHHSIWKSIADDFNAEPEYLSSATEREHQQPLPLKLSEGGSKISVVGRERVQEMFRRIADVFPDYRMRAVDVSTTVHEKARWAISYVSMETYEMPPGVVRQSLGVFEWKLMNAQWLLCKYQGMVGIAPE